MRRSLRFFCSPTTIPANRPFRTVVCCFVLLASFAALQPAGRAQDFGLKNLQGKVYDAQDATLQGAIVYLQNSRNNDVKTFISATDGNYRFAALSADTDYTVWAVYQGRKSPTKTISSFDSRKQVVIDLHLR
jgi:hypothetical protein